MEQIIMFDSKHYVPILKWKRAEQGALKALEGRQKKNITPLIQLVMPKNKPDEQFKDVIKRFERQLTEIPAKLIDVWGNLPIFVDVSLLYSTSLKAKALYVLSEEGQKLRGTFIPVIHLTDDEQIKKSALVLATDSKNGLCLRLICSDFSNMTELSRNISKLLSEGLREKDIDLLVDIKETENNVEKYARYINLSQDIPSLLKWRTFIFASGSFPEDLSNCAFDEENLIPRIDWICWQKNIVSRLRRKPTFADYTIQHPIYKENNQFYYPTSSIKYSLENEWLIMKGKRQKFELYLASAAELVKDRRFYGEYFSDGDKYIYEKAKHFPVYLENPAVKGTGSTETWLKAGINHHLSLVESQVSSLV
jgi:hypothetical protein